MSFFKEKDDHLTAAFRSQFNRDTDEESDEDIEKVPTSSTGSQDDLQENRSSKKPKLDASQSEPSSSQSSLITDVQDDKHARGGGGDSPELVDLVDDNEPSETNVEKKPYQHDGSVVVLSSSDDEDCPLLDQGSTASAAIQDSAAANVSLEFDEDDFNLKLMVSGAYKQFPTKRKVPLRESLNALIMEARAKGRQLIVTQDTTIISMEESPYSLKLKPGVILNAIEALPEADIAKDVQNPDMIHVKLQDGNRRHNKEFCIHKNEPISKLKDLWAEEYGIQSTGLIQLMIDGDVLDDDQTPEDLEIEDDYCIDVLIK